GSMALYNQIHDLGLQHSPDIIAYFEKFRGGRAELEEILHPRYPSQLYEALGEGLLLSAVLIFIRLRFPRLRQGIVTGLFFIFYASARIALEFVRQPDSGSSLIMGLTKGQFFSTFMYLVGGIFIAYGLIWGKSPPGPAAAKA
uniref:prolipoprotein diacylglyceryl transferase family protein n=1 Tax=Prosthecobacter sp. TaxID=1965333 RepID=UPI003782DF43